MLLAIHQSHFPTGLQWRIGPESGQVDKDNGIAAGGLSKPLKKTCRQLVIRRPGLATVERVQSFRRNGNHLERVALVQLGEEKRLQRIYAGCLVGVLAAAGNGQDRHPPDRFRHPALRAGNVGGLVGRGLRPTSGRRDGTAGPEDRDGRGQVNEAN